MTLAAAYLETLNPEQRRAVEHGVEKQNCRPGQPLLVIAGAGSGKTNTLAHRVAHLIVNGADPRRILLMTFSRRAAAEMTRRVERIARQVMGQRADSMTDALAWAGTFHGIGARLLRDYADQIGLDPTFTIHDREDSADLMNLVRHTLGFSKTESRFPTKRTCLAIYSRAVNSGDPLDEMLGSNFPWCAAWEKQLRELFAAYTEIKQQHNVLDYDDLLLYWAQTVSDPLLAADIGGQWDHVLVDEYQDTNRLQSSILLALKPGGRGLTVVGDDAQSIYSFRAATVRNILEFPNAFSPAADIITLDRNYRSTRPILAAANGVIELARERFTKTLWTERASAARPQLVAVRDEAAQAGYIVEQVLSNRETGTTLKQQAVLFRTSHHSGPLEVELTRRNIPFVKFGGLKFLDSAHVKDVLALLRFASLGRCTGRADGGRAARQHEPSEERHADEAHECPDRQSRRDRDPHRARRGGARAPRPSPCTPRTTPRRCTRGRPTRRARCAAPAPPRISTPSRSSPRARVRLRRDPSRLRVSQRAGGVRAALRGRGPRLRRARRPRRSSCSATRRARGRWPSAWACRCSRARRHRRASTRRARSSPPTAPGRAS